MKIKDVIQCGIQDLRTQKKKNRTAFILLFFSIIVYVGVNSTVKGIKNGSYSVLNGHATRILYMQGNDDSKEEYKYLKEKCKDDERIKEIYIGMAYYTGMVWHNCFDTLGVYSQDMFFSSCYNSLFDYGYMGEKRLPSYNEIILPRYMYEYGIYDEYTYADGDKLIGDTLVFKNEAYRYGNENLEEYKLKVIGTYDNITKKYNNNVIFCNTEFMSDIIDEFNQRKWQIYQENGDMEITKEMVETNLDVYLFIEEGYNINDVWSDLNTEICKDLNIHPDNHMLKYLTYMDPEVEGYYYYIVTIANLVSIVLLCVAIINILISSLSEIKEREWEFALKQAMGYRYIDIVKIFAVEKIMNVLKSLCVAVIILILYSVVITYYNQSMLEYWKRSWVITIDIKIVIVSMVMVVTAALMGVIVSNFSMGRIKIADKLKFGE